MSDVDLPPPPKRELSSEEISARQWRLLEGFLGFTAIYSSLHRFLLPLVLKFTALSQTPYAQFSFWFIHPIVLFFLLKKHKRLTPVSAALCGMGICFGAYELWQTQQGVYQGWLAFSHLLSALPVAGIALMILTQKWGSGLGKWGWAGALTTGILLMTYHQYSSRLESQTTQHVRNDNDTVSKASGDLLTKCGDRNIVLGPGSKIPEALGINVSPCGFEPQVYLHSSETLSVVNGLDEAINVHIVVFSAGKRETLWNKSAPPRSTISQPLKLKPNQVAVLFSDSHPDKGVVGITPHLPERSWSISRSPVALKELP